MTLADAFEAQARACAELGSPLTARILRVAGSRIAPGTPLNDRLLAWPGDISGRGAALALRLAGGLHALVLARADAALAAVYATPAEVDDAGLWEILDAALARHSAFLMDWITSPPQTNEVRRSAALIAGAQWLNARFGLPLVLSELGASAGLNLLWDRYALDLGAARFGPEDTVLTLRPDWRGPLPPAGRPVVAARAGVDLNPLDPLRDRLRLLAYIWADQHDRLERTKAALETAAQARPEVHRGDAIDWLAERLKRVWKGRLHLVCHTIAWQYFPADAQARGAALLAEAGARATPEAPLAHLAMEADDGTEGAGLTLQLWPGDQTIRLGRVDFHGRWLHWNAPASQE